LVLLAGEILRSHHRIGKYADRRTGQPVDSSKIIWVLASNSLDETVRDFHVHRNRSPQDLTGGTDLDEAANELQKVLLASARSKLGVRLMYPLLLLRKIANRQYGVVSTYRTAFGNCTISAILRRRTGGSCSQELTTTGRKSSEAGSPAR
jgi:hypothetical protein